jgi:hypothetical protein
MIDHPLKEQNDWRVIKRRRSDSNRGMKVLQTSVLNHFTTAPGKSEGLNSSSIRASEDEESSGCPKSDLRLFGSLLATYRLFDRSLSAARHRHRC